jgi:YVTN family beta-propeller protein
VTGDGRGTVQKIDLATNKIVTTIHIAPDAGSHGVSFGLDAKLLFITNTCASTISVIDTATDEVIDTVRSRLLRKVSPSTAPRRLLPWHRSNARWIAAVHRAMAVAIAQLPGNGEKRSVNTIPPPGLSAKVTVP